MEFKFNYKPINLSCSKDEHRTSLNYVSIDSDDMMASNGHILTRYSSKRIFLEMSFEETIYIHRQDWETLKGYDFVTKIEGSENLLKFIDSKKKKRPNIIEVSTGINFPKMKDMFPSKNRWAFETNNFMFSFCLDYLLAAKKLIGNRVIFEFTTKTVKKDDKQHFNRVNNIIVTKHYDELTEDEQNDMDFCMIMPILSDQEFSYKSKLLK